MRPLTIGIAGGTASGKTTVARRLVERLAGHPTALLDQDAYYRDLSDVPIEERAQFNFDHPDAFDIARMVEHIAALKGIPRLKKLHLRYVTVTDVGQLQVVLPWPPLTLEKAKLTKPKTKSTNPGKRSPRPAECSG